MSRAQLIAMAKHNMAHARAGTIEQEAGIFEVPVQNYFDEDRWRLEMNRIFKRMPLMLAITDELRNPGDYKAIEAAGVPVLLARGTDGEVRAFVNMCRHRGSQIVGAGRGNSHRFTCPYHAWSYDQTGALVGVYAPADFGELDNASNGLVPLPVAERAGMIWAILNPKATLDIDTFLSGYDEVLAHFGFENWHLFDQRTLAGPNWKIAYDGYMDLYHVPILHRETFGDQFSNQALYYAWGPHQRVNFPDPSLANYADKPEAEWNEAHMMAGVWTIFPHVSIAGFDGGGRGVMISQLFPGRTPQESFTVQNYVMENQPTDEQAQAATQQFKLLEYVVAEEDYATGLRQQAALMTGAMSHVKFGRNEGGGQRFHQWLDTLLATEDEDLNALFKQSERYC